MRGRVKLLPMTYGSRESVRQLFEAEKQIREGDVVSSGLVRQKPERRTLKIARTALGELFEGEPDVADLA